MDDIADTEGPRDARIAALDQYRADVASLYAGLPPGQMKGFVEPLKQFGFRKEDFLAVIDGMEMDVICRYPCAGSRDARSLLRPRRQRRRPALGQGVRRTG